MPPVRRGTATRLGLRPPPPPGPPLWACRCPLCEAMTQLQDRIALVEIRRRQVWLRENV